MILKKSFENELITSFELLLGNGNNNLILGGRRVIQMLALSQF